MDTKAAQKQLVGLIARHLSESIPVTRILTYKPNKNGSVTGKFESLNRVFNFVFSGNDVRYKPAMNADSALFSEYFLERFDATPRGTRALPKCTSKSYSCKGNVGVRCLPLTQSCKIGNSAIGNERLSKIKNLSKSLAAAGEDTTKTEATRAKIVEGRMALAAENRAKRTPKKVEKQPKRKGVEAINEKRKALEEKGSGGQKKTEPKVSPTKFSEENLAETTKQKLAGRMPSDELVGEELKVAQKKMIDKLSSINKGSEKVEPPKKEEAVKAPETKAATPKSKTETPKTKAKATGTKTSFAVGKVKDRSNIDDWDDKSLNKSDNIFEVKQKDGSIVGAVGYSIKDGNSMIASIPVPNPELSLSKSDLQGLTTEGIKHLVKQHKKEGTNQLVINTKEPQAVEALKEMGFEFKPSARFGRDAYIAKKTFD